MAPRIWSVEDFVHVSLKSIWKWAHHKRLKLPIRVALMIHTLKLNQLQGRSSSEAITTTTWSATSSWFEPQNPPPQISSVVHYWYRRDKQNFISWWAGVLANAWVLTKKDSISRNHILLMKCAKQLMTHHVCKWESLGYLWWGLRPGEVGGFAPGDGGG